MPEDRPDARSRHLPWWLWPNLLSLDAPLVAVSWLALFQSAYRVYAMPQSVYWLLFAAVWVIYCTDRLIDGSALGSRHALEARHRIHRRLRPLLWPLLITVTVVSIWQALTTLPATLTLCTLFLSGFVALYLIHRVLVSDRVVPILPKELFCGLLFAIGTALAPRVSSGRIESSSPGLLGSLIKFVSQAFAHEVVWVGLLFTFNCVAIACWERRGGGEQDPTALPSAVPELRDWLSRLLLALALGAGFVSWQWGHPDTSPIYLAVSLGALGLLALDWQKERLDRHQLRVLADLCLLTPWLIIPFLN